MCDRPLPSDSGPFDPNLPADPSALPETVFDLAELLLRFRWTPDELRQAGLEEKDFRLMVNRLRLLLLNEGWEVTD